ncbi:hypothetical protein KUTeg_004511 [Tegillarca granosa]|uniref:UDENN FNIP1/2-type domain-containing protein n=1 Tax=Tegillarca granosa TaxID=220873 RepID=A0ABQ9FT10_TEGGR|nr:hypothetical protein KUTeg_004511 [Tegillarca granosa]
MGLKSIYGIIFENQECHLDKSITKRWNAPKFDKDKVRLVIFNDNERDRQILFDSKAIKRIDETQVESKVCSHRARMAARFRKVAEVEKSSEVDAASKCKFQFQKPGSDVQMMEEMMFGCVGMAYKGTSLKVHFLKSPPQMMLTKVFIPENPKRESMGSELDSDSCSYHSHSDHSGPKQISQQNNKNNSNIAQSVPVDVPSPRETRASFELIDEDSGLASLTSSGSFHTPLPSPGSNASSFNSLHRRWMRVQSTSLEGCLRKRNSQDNLLAQDTQSAPTRSRKRKIALGILFDLSENDDEYNRRPSPTLSATVYLELFSLLLSTCAQLSVNMFLFPVYVKTLVALDAFRNDVMDLYVTPRLSEPVWLNMMAYSNYRYVLCEKFMKEFMDLVKYYDNKNNNFFVSTLVTAVLTHHLAWVPTVMPAGGSPSRTYLDKHSAKWLDTFSKVHPYNPLWAQLGLGSFGQGIRPRISSISRQISADKSARPTTLAPGRCRSVTPTELRRRHLSSNSSLDFDFLDPLIHCKEIEMPNFSDNVKGSSITVFDRNFGRSLLAGYSNHYLSDFVLHGTSDDRFHDKLVNDLKMHIQHSVLDEPIGEAVCVIADTDNWTVNVASSRLIDKQPSSTQQVVASQLVLNLTEAVLQLWKLKMSPEFCLMHLEDRLQEIYFKSKMLAEYLKDVKKYNIKDLTQLLGFDTSDVPLLVAIAGTHSPHLSLGLI